MKALAAFQKVSVPVDVLLAAIASQKKSPQWQKDNGQFIPHPATWLNGQRWEDQPFVEQQSGKRELDEDERRCIERMLGGMQ